MTQKKIKGRIKAVELQKRLAQIPEYVAQQEKRDRDIAERKAMSEKEQAPLLKDLREAGRAVENVWDLVNTRERYPEVIPVLASHLVLPYSPGIREGIARALTVREAKGEWDLLLKEFLKEEEDKTSFGVKWALANAMSVLLNDELVVQVFDIVQDEKHGESRHILIDSFGKLKNPAVRDVLLQLCEDPVVSDVARKSLLKFDKKANRSKRKKRNK